MRLLCSTTHLLAVLISLYSPRSLTGQEALTVAPGDQVLLTSSAHLWLLPIYERRFSLGTISKEAFRYHQNLNLIWTQTSAPPKTRKPRMEKVKRAAIDPSMVGYIDNAAIHTEVRVRFDGAVHNDTPDRAEFFYGKCGCYRSLPVGSPNYDPNSPGPGPGIPRYVNFQQLYFQGEYAPRSRFSLFTQIPIRWLQPHAAPGILAAFSSSGGISDVQLGFKLAAIATPRRYLTFQLRSALPSGDSRRGLGTNHASIEPAILYYQQITNRLSVEGQIGDTHPIGGSHGVPTASSSGFAGDVFFYGVGSSYLLIDHENFQLSPVLELVGWNVISGLATGRTSTDGVNIVNLKIGPRMTFGAHSSFYAGYGIALTSQTWYREIFRTEYRYAF
jgi:hypothetical protein